MSVYRWVSVVVMLVLFEMGCAQPRYVHCVFFTCKPGTSPEAMKAQVDDAYGLLRRVPTVRAVESGLRDSSVNRADLSVTDWDVALVVRFDDRAGYKAYETDPIHRQYVEDNRSIWDKVRVFDFAEPVR